MKKIIFSIILFSLLMIPVNRAEAQSNVTTSSTTITFASAGTVPGWVKDIRRFDIIAFGSFPFSMFFVTFTMDMIRWNNANGLDFTEQGRRYAPWPLKSAGAVEMTNDEYLNTILIAAGLSLTFALIDLLIINIKRNSERRRLESMPSGSIIIERNPQDEDPGGEDGFTE